MAETTGNSTSVFGDPVFDAGVQEGRLQARKEVLTFIEEKYMSDTIERGSEEGNALLAVAREVSQFLKP